MVSPEELFEGSDREINSHRMTNENRKSQVLIPFLGDGQRADLSDSLRTSNTLKPKGPRRHAAPYWLVHLQQHYNSNVVHKPKSILHSPSSTTTTVAFSSFRLCLSTATHLDPVRLFLQWPCTNQNTLLSPLTFRYFPCHSNAPPSRHTHSTYPPRPIKR